MLSAAPEHSALMDGVYRHQRHLYDFTRKFYLFGRDSLIRDLALAPAERVVEVGCGTARNLIAMAHRYPQAHLYGLDASSEMLKTAAAAVARAGLTDRITLVHGLAEEMSPAMFDRDTVFDRVIFSYSLSMIPQWKQALVAGAGAVGKTGRIDIVDFGDFARLPRFAASLLRRWLSLFHVAPRSDFLNALESPGFSNAGILRIFPGRYAFIWRGGAKAVESLPS